MSHVQTEENTKVFPFQDVSAFMTAYQKEGGALAHLHAATKNPFLMRHLIQRVQLGLDMEKLYVADKKGVQQISEDEYCFFDPGLSFSSIRDILYHKHDPLLRGYAYGSHINGEWVNEETVPQKRIIRFTHYSALRNLEDQKQYAEQDEQLCGARDVLTLLTLSSMQIQPPLSRLMVSTGTRDIQGQPFVITFHQDDHEQDDDKGVMICSLPSLLEINGGHNPTIAFVRNAPED